MLKGSTGKEVNVCFVDKLVHSNSLINVQPEENGMLSYGNTIPRNFDVWFIMLRKTFRIEELQCCSDVEVLVCNAVKKVQVLVAEKKIGVDWPRQSQFRKNLQCPNVQIKKSAWTGLGKNKKAFQRQVSLNFLHDWSPGGRRSVLHFDGLPLTRGAVDATPFVAAVSLTFSLVNNLKMLLQAKRQPGYKIPGRVVDRAYWWHEWQKTGMKN
jgi:hypothetical protein